MVKIAKEEINKNIKKGETFATGMVRPKTTALFFDRLWVPELLTSGFVKNRFPKFSIPYEICMENPLSAPNYIEAWALNVESEVPKSKLLFHFSGEIMKTLLQSQEQGSVSFKESSTISTRYRDDHDSQPVDHIDTLLGKVTTVNRNNVIKELVTEYKKFSINLTPIYLTPTKYDEINIVGKKNGLEICLDFIPDIVEDKLTWKQVLEFRKDKTAKTKLDRLRRWFNIDLLKKNEEEIKNILGQKLDDYQWALKKHGIQTLIGGSTSIMSFVSGPTLLKLLTDSPLAMFSGGIAIGAGAVAWIAKKIIERTDLKRDPVAYIYEVRKLENK